MPACELPRENEQVWARVGVGEAGEPFCLFCMELTSLTCSERSLSNIENRPCLTIPCSDQHLLDVQITQMYKTLISDYISMAL